MSNQTKDFAVRLNAAVAANPNVPQLHHGERRWISDRLNAIDGAELSAESVRRWLTGDVMPRENRIIALAKILGVDYNWLRFGIGGPQPVSRYATHSDEARPDFQAGNAAAKAILTGMIFFSGGKVQDRGEVLQAQVGRTTYAIVPLGASADGDGWIFNAPADASDTVVLGVIRTDEMNFVVLDMEWEAVTKHGTPGPDGYDIRVDANLQTNGHAWKQIQNFRGRL